MDRPTALPVYTYARACVCVYVCVYVCIVCMRTYPALCRMFVWFEAKKEWLMIAAASNVSEPKIVSAAA